MSFSALHHVKFPFKLIGMLVQHSIPFDPPLFRALLEIDSRIAFSTEPATILNEGVNDTLRAALNESFGSDDNNGNNRAQSGNGFSLRNSSLFTKAKIFSPIAWTLWLTSCLQYSATFFIDKITKNCPPKVKTFFLVLVNLPPALIKVLLDLLGSPGRNLTAILDCIKNTITPTAVEGAVTSATAGAVPGPAGPVPAVVPVPAADPAPAAGPAPAALALTLA
jgi:hypothetical protein